MAKLIFIVGSAGAGKTSVARALVARRPAAFLDMDTLLRPAAETIMTMAGLDPTDRDSPLYKERCRNLGYRITMDAALENVQLGLDAVVIGPFTRETSDPAWLDHELARIGAARDIVRVIVVSLPDTDQYYTRIRDRGSELDVWKLEHWETFKSSLADRDIHWQLPPSAILKHDNSGPLDSAVVDRLEQFVWGRM
ncbi:AAA family ATPase [Paenibacillus daejeonensis]|uniref:AAA family ATPase n=1 Tax=Paenibacillus daejeonensis TaxID=135193 RepID=UPI000361EA87|nr:AAA family ATPase [Paenibacillus daejeonensis]